MEVDTVDKISERATSVENIPIQEDEEEEEEEENEEKDINNNNDNKNKEKKQNIIELRNYSFSI